MDAMDAMDADDALRRAWSLGMDEAGWSDAAMDEAECLLPTLLKAGYVTVDEESGTWAFRTAGVARAEALEGGVAGGQ